MLIAEMDSPISMRMEHPYGRGRKRNIGRVELACLGNSNICVSIFISIQMYKFDGTGKV